MINTSSAFRDAIVADSRYIELFVVVDISDPDKVILPATSSPGAPWSRPDQLTDYDLSAPPRLATLEHGRWLLGGGFKILPDDYSIPQEVGYASAAISGADGAFAAPQWIQINFSGVRILQAFAVYFSTDPLDGVPEDFTVEVFSGSQKYFEQAVTGNTKTEVQFRDFTVQLPTAARITVTRWSLPSRRMRMVEFVIGFFERWTGDMLESFAATLQGQFSSLTLPYGTVEMSVDNHDRLFEPRNKNSIFQSIEERQGLDLFVGCQTAQGMERIKIGVFYQTGDGWKTSENAPTIRWSLVDIIGLVAERTFLVPDTLPTTAGGWFAAVVGQLGDAFKNRWHVDPDYVNAPVTANSREDVSNKKCRDIIRWVCQAAGIWARADQSTGALTGEPLWNQGAKVDLDNLESYPAMQANESLAALIFQLADGQGTEVVIQGNATSAEKTVTIVNPFLHTVDQARTASRLILAQYGGNIYETTGRGNPASEIGDVDTIWLDESNAATARRMMQTFEFRDGVMRGCRSRMLQADGSYLWTEFEVIRVSGTWQAPPGVRQLRIVLSDGGQGGGYGQNGSRFSAGDPGADGQGGRVWFGVIDINEEQEFDVNLGQGGSPGAGPGQAGSPGGHTTFGPYSSADGVLYPGGYTDIANGQAFARTGVAAPLPGTGDGGKGGEGGTAGVGYWETVYWTPDIPGYSESNAGNPRGQKYVEIEPPGPGSPGVAGATGFAMVTWEKPNTTH